MLRSRGRNAESYSEKRWQQSYRRQRERARPLYRHKSCRWRLAFLYRHSVPCFRLLSQRYLHRCSEDCPLALHRYTQIPRAYDQPSMAAALAMAAALTSGGRPDITSATLSFSRTSLGRSLSSNLSWTPFRFNAWWTKDLGQTRPSNYLRSSAGGIKT